MYSNSVAQILPKSYEELQVDRMKRATGNSDSMDQEAFLRLLVVQMQNQDPLNPMDNAEFTQQTTAFSQLEQLMNMNKNMTQLIENQLSQNPLDNAFANSAAFIGKTIEYDTNSVRVTPGLSTPIQFYASEAAMSGRVTIFNSEGNLVGILNSGAITRGANAIAWDGKDSGGVQLQEGMYSFRVEATGLDGQPVQFSLFGEGQVMAIKVSGGVMYFELESGGLVPAQNVYAVKEAAKPVNDDKKDD